MKLLLAILVWSLAPCAYAGSIEHSTRGLPRVGAPPQGEVQWIARSMRHNGLPMTLQSFHSRLAAADVLRHYEARAKAETARESMRSRRGDWQMLTLKGAGYFITIQARDSTPGSVGTITVTADPAGTEQSLATHFPLPSSTQVVSVQQYEDRGDQAEHISLVSARAPHAEALSCAQTLSRAGWQLIQDAPARSIQRGHVIEAQKGAAHARLTFMPDRSQAGRTAIIIVWKKA
jgi:hypothetical protein